jgi:cytochrome b involved in lipid metabolism
MIFMPRSLSYWELTPDPRSPLVDENLCTCTSIELLFINLLRSIPSSRIDPSQDWFFHIDVKMPHQSITRATVAKNNTEDSLWIIIDSKVYDVTEFVDAHPGGEYVLRQVAGKDATEAFYNLHRQEVLQNYSNLCLGTLEGEKSQAIEHKAGDLSLVPYGEPTWLSQQFKSPYYNDSHRRLQKAVRLFVDTYITPVAQECEKTGEHIPQDLIDRMSRVGLLHMRLGPGKHLHGVDLMDGTMKGEDFDAFHDLIIGQEIVRASARGFQDGNMSGMMISLTAVFNFANNEAWKNKIAQEVLSGRKKICLAITEAFAGSDVAGIRTTATKTPDGKHFIVNGTKKWVCMTSYSSIYLRVISGEPHSPYHSRRHNG